MSEVEYNFEFADKFPYGDHKAKNKYERTALAILNDLTGRRGIKRGFEDIDQDIQTEIIERMAAIIERGTND